ncbi:hypothetical protein WDH52_22720 [Streptomyces sp. TRM70308]
MSSPSPSQPPPPEPFLPLHTAVVLLTAIVIGFVLVFTGAPAVAAVIAV